MINSRRIEDLTPEMQVLCKKFIEECKTQGIDIIITSTYRDFESQDALYAQGRTKPGIKVTNAKGGFSFHNFRVAFDICIVVNGKADWSNTALYNKVGQIGKAVGLDWAGDWVSFKELVHFQLPGLTIKKLRYKAGLSEN